MKSTIQQSLLAVLVLALSITTASGRTLSESEVRAVAQRFITENGFLPSAVLQPVQHRTASHAPGRTQQAAPAYYIYDVTNANGGYVIASADDRVAPVLGYSDTGCYDPTNEALAEWLEAMEQEISSLPDDDNTQYAPQRALGASVQPLIKTNWAQGAPYNALLPIVSNGNRAVTGCVATAMAQILYYYKYPSKPTKTIPEYTTETQDIYMPSLPVVNFAWSTMIRNYQQNATDAAANAVAQLMLYCSQSLTMDFKDKSSSAQTLMMPYVLGEYFGYTTSSKYIIRSHYTTSAWNNLLYKELAASRPVVYRGQTMRDGGHSFICDGYDANTGMFHFNWGWNGQSNGYFVLSALNPSSQGTGSSEGAEGYIKGQAMVIGIAPSNASVIPPTSSSLTISRLSLSNTNYSRSSTSSDFANVTWSARFNNYTGEVQNYYCGWALYRGNEFVSILPGYFRLTDLKQNYGLTKEVKVSFGANLATGNYKIYPVSRTETGNWEKCEGADRNHLEATVSTTSLYITVVGGNATPTYRLNNVSFKGNQRVGKTVEITANLNNVGNTVSDNIYLLVDGVKNTIAVAEIEKGASGDVKFFYTPTTTGTKSLKFALDSLGVNTLGVRSLSISSMPQANLSMTLRLTNGITASSGTTIKGTTAQVSCTATNKLSSTYDEDIVARVCRLLYTGKGTAVQAQSQPVKISGNSSATTSFTFKDLSPGESYFIIFYYFSNGELVRCSTVPTFKVVDGTAFLPGDVNLDGIVDVTDVNLIIDFVLGKKTPTSTQKTAADLDGNGIIDVTDVNKAIDIVLGK